MAKRFINHVCCFIFLMFGLFYVSWNMFVGIDFNVTTDEEKKANLNHLVSAISENIVYPSTSQGDTCRTIQKLARSRIKSVCDKISENYTKVSH